MRIEQIVCVATTAFTLGICEAMAAPIDLQAQPRPLDDPSPAEPAEPGDPCDRSEPPGEADEAIPRCELDGCEYEHQGCVCSNTGWNGYCGWGPHHPGCLYCRCD